MRKSAILLTLSLGTVAVTFPSVTGAAYAALDALLTRAVVVAGR